MKNIMLGLVTFLLACFLAFLLFIATNQYALIKVHEFICSKPHVKNIVVNKVESMFSNYNTIDAAIQPKGLNNPRSGKRSIAIAQNTTNISNNDEVANKHLPQFTSAIGSAQSMVNSNNQSHNRYHDYAIDKSFNGKYYYIFTFENAKQKGTYCRVTVNSNNSPKIFDMDFKPVKTKKQNINVTNQEKSVIAQMYARDQLSSHARLQNERHTTRGIIYSFIDSLNNKQLKVSVTNSGNVVNLPTRE